MKSATLYQSVFAPGTLQGQVILVTGGGSGIGRCTAHELASLGAHVVLVGRNPDKLTATAQESRVTVGKPVGTAATSGAKTM